MLAAAKGDAEHSAALFGAIERKLREGGVTLFGPLERELQGSYLVQVRRDLGEALFDNAFERGLENAGELALDPLSSP